jgi:hypothetical protein
MSKVPTLSEVAEIVDCEHKTAPPAAPGSEFGFSVGTPALRLNFINYKEAKRVDEDTYRTWSKRAELQEGDIILAREAPVGGVGLVGAGERVCLGQRTVLVRPKKGIADPLFVYYFLQSRDCQEWMRNRSSGSTVAHLNVSDIRDIPFSYFPNLEVQRELGLQIRALDELAEHNRILLESILSFLVSLLENFQRARSTRPLEDFYTVGLSGVWGKDERTQKESVKANVLRGRDLEDYVDALEVSPPARFLSPGQLKTREPSVGEIWTAGSGSLGPSMPICSETYYIASDGPLLYSNFVKRLLPKSDVDWFGTAWVCMVAAWQKGDFQTYRSGTAMPNLDVAHMLGGIQVPEMNEDERKQVNSLVEVFLSFEIRNEIQKCNSSKKALIELLLSGAPANPTESTKESLTTEELNT